MKTHETPMYVDAVTMAIPLVSAEASSAAMAPESTAVIASPPVRLACIEVCNFRRLSRTRLDLDQETTVLVGANNSGKTSLLTVLRNFLSETSAFRAYDLSLSNWAKLRDLSQRWEMLADDPINETKEDESWAYQLQGLFSCMPFVDLWFDAKEGAYNHVAPFITSLKWAGGPVGIRVRLEPVSNIDDLRKLASAYRASRAPVRTLPKNGHAWPVDIIDYWLGNPGDLRRVSAYRLDPMKGPLVIRKDVTLQVLAADAKPVEINHLRKLIRVDFVSAQRGLGAEEDEAKS